MRNENEDSTERRGDGYHNEPTRGQGIPRQSGDRGGCPSASLRRFAMGMTVETFFSMETDLMPTLKMRDYKDPPVIVYEAD